MTRERQIDKHPDRFQPKGFLARWQNWMTTKEYRQNQTIFAQGDPSDAVFYIEKGRVNLIAVSRQGKKIVVAILNDGSFLGEACLSGQAVRPATARTETAGILTRIPKRVVTRALREDFSFSEYFVSYLLARNLRIEEDLMDQLFNSSEKRLARALLLLANFGKDGRSETVMPRVSQEMLAGMVGVTRERVSHLMNKFRRLGLVKYNGELSVHSSLINVIHHD